MTVDNFLPDKWPPEVVAALDEWRQGHLIRGNVGTWIALGGVKDPVTGEDVPGAEGDMTARADIIGSTGYMAVVSQTCDVAATGPGARHPFVQVSPVRNIDNLGPHVIQAIKDGLTTDYVYLTSPPTPGSDWAVDLRVSLAVSKGLLAASEPVQGFGTEVDEIRFSQRVGSKYERPAVHDYLSEDMVKSLDRVISKAKGTQDWCDDVEQLRLQILEGTRLQPKKIRLVVVTETDFNSRFTDLGRKKVLRDAWKAHKKPLKALGIEWTPIRFQHLGRMSVEDYRQSLPINLSALGKGRWT